MLLSVSEWRRILRWKIETKSAPKTIFSGNGNGLKNFTFLSTWEQKNVHTVYVKQDYVYRDGHTLRGHFSIGTIGPRESVLCSQRSSDVIRVQSLWECVKYRDKWKNNRGPRRVWSFTNVCTHVFFCFCVHFNINLPRSYTRTIEDLIKARKPKGTSLFLTYMYSTSTYGNGLSTVHVYMPHFNSL